MISRKTKINSKKNYDKSNSRKTKKGGGNAPPANSSTIDLSTLSKEEIESLTKEGISLQELKNMGGSTQSQILNNMIAQQPAGSAPIEPIAPQNTLSPNQNANYNQNINANGQGMNMSSMPANPSDYKTFTKSKQFPALMNLAAYSKYKSILDTENNIARKHDIERLEKDYNKEAKESLEQKKKNNNNKEKEKLLKEGYVFSDLMDEDILREMKRTQGSFFVGVNLSNLFNEFRSIVNRNTKNSSGNRSVNSSGNVSSNDTKNSNETFRRVGEWVDVDFEKTLKNKMGFRNSDISLLPELSLTDASTFTNIVKESKIYANTGFDGKITPKGLLTMTRMLFKYKKSNAQWLRVATVLELIYKYLGTTQSRENFFKTTAEIPILALMEIEEFYNTDHIFMTNDEIKAFKTDLEFYKYKKEENE